MTVIDTQSINPSFVKMRWQEPYVSNAVNRSHFKTTPRGIYRGFEVSPGPGAKEVTVSTSTFAGLVGYVSGYASGNFDSASGWSIAMHESQEGFGVAVAIPVGASGDFTFDLTAHSGTSVYLAIDVNYSLGYATTANIEVVDSDQLDIDPTLIVISKINVPGVGPISSPNIIYDDDLYPRILPYANKYHDGYMNAAQAEVVEILSTAPNASNAFEEEFVVAIAGPQTIDIPGANVYTINGRDLLIFINGVKMTKGRDYDEIDRGDGYGEQVSFTRSLRIDDRIIFRGQAYAVSLTSTMAVLDENALVQTNVTQMNFQGLGVLVTPGGPGIVNVQIPSPQAAGSSESKQNITGSTILAFRTVTLLTDGSMAPLDPTVSTHKLYGITTTDVLNGNFGVIALDGVVQGGVSGLGFSVNDDVFVSHVGDGSLTTTPPPPLNGSVIRVGIANCSDNTTSSVATDLVFDRERIV